MSHRRMFIATLMVGLTAMTAQISVADEEKTESVTLNVAGIT